MIQIAISLLALAAGVHLLIKVQQSGLGGIYRILSWLVILLSLGFILCGVARGVNHSRQSHECHASGHCGWERHGGMDCPYMKDGGCEAHGGANGMCNHQGCAEAGKPACCKDGVEGNKPACCSKDGGEAKAACCKKDMSKADSDSTSRK